MDAYVTSPEIATVMSTLEDQGRLKTLILVIICACSNTDPLTIVQACEIMTTRDARIKAPR